MAALSRLAVI